MQQPALLVQRHAPRQRHLGCVLRLQAVGHFVDLNLCAPSGCRACPGLQPGEHGIRDFKAVAGLLGTVHFHRLPDVGQGHVHNLRVGQLRGRAFRGRGLGRRGGGRRLPAAAGQQGQAHKEQGQIP
ncbi:hypothetical protein SDC9_118283 [bioreactor metagenome]|uniref:Uncharacterized protein n=1 Tax=bioreactor metagenome TaxID=1076179 RepID=A0A645C114_9ZZZZ